MDERSTRAAHDAVADSQACADFDPSIAGEEDPGAWLDMVATRDPPTSTAPRGIAPCQVREAAQPHDPTPQGNP
jgi:hypothetical protein